MVEWQSRNVRSCFILLQLSIDRNLGIPYLGSS
jgi:hypothetical protein